MWNPKIVDYDSEINKVSIKPIISGSIPAIVIKNFSEKNQCKELVKKIEQRNPSIFQNKRFLHIGSFLMEFVTRKEEYFENADKFKLTFQRIFEKNNPIKKIHNTIGAILPGYSVSVAEENGKQHSPCVIRIHEKGKSIPIHKDNVKYEGRDYDLSNIDQQLSCVLHLQESEEGGDIIIYKKQWSKKHEKFRNIEFGYSQDAIESTEVCKISNLNSGDLVILNPNHYHEVTKIRGSTPRISLGMFLGIYKKTRKIVTWA